MTDTLPYATPCLMPAANRPPFGRLFVASAADGRLTQLEFGEQPVSRPFWSADGGSLFYWSNSEQWRAKVDGRERVALGSAIRFAGQDESYDYFFTGAGHAVSRSLFRIPKGGGEQELVVDDVQAPLLALTRESLYVVRSKSNTLCVLPRTRRGRIREIGHLPELDGRRSLMGLSVTSDDRAVIWAVKGTISGEVDLHLVRDFR